MAKRLSADDVLDVVAAVLRAQHRHLALVGVPPGAGQRSYLSMLTCEIFDAARATYPAIDPNRFFAGSRWEGK